jgi:3-oxoacyl-[acyl-carrier protein] reductase
MDFSMYRMKGNVALITGSGRGFGRSIAISYAKEGAMVIGVARTRSELENTAEIIHESGGESMIIPTDLTKEDEIYNMKDQVKANFDRLDVLVNNAAHNPRKNLENTTPEIWDRTMALNVKAPFMLSKIFFETMKHQGGGSIINISSKSAEMGFVHEMVYCPSKYGIEGLTQCLALELFPFNIAVNSLQVSAPLGKRLKPGGITLEQLGYLPSELGEEYADDESMVEAYKDAWVFLGLQDASGLTGQRFVTRELAEYLRRNGWEAAVANWKGKLRKAVYVSYDFPKSVRFRTPNHIWKDFKF